MLDIVFAGLRTPRPGGGLRLLISMCPPTPPQLSSSAQQGLRGRTSAMRPVPAQRGAEVQARPGLVTCASISTMIIASK